MGPRSPSYPDLPFAPNDASLDARRVPAQTSTEHLHEVSRRVPASPTARSPIRSLWPLTSARSDLGKGRDTNFQPAH